MKKYIALLSIFVAVCMIGCKKEKPVAVAVNGLVNIISGTVKIDNNGAITEAKPGDQISEGMKVSTVGPKSFVEIYIGENAIKIIGDSSMVFSRLAIIDGGQVTDLSVQKGGVFSKISKKLEKNDTYTIKTSNAVAAVRGTEFMVEDNGIKSNIACVDGKVEVADVKTPAKTVTLEQKQEVSVEAGSELVVKQIESDRLRQLQIVSDIKEIQKDIKQKYEDQKADMRRKFEEQREEIRKAVVDQKDKDKAMVQKQKDEDKARIDNQKATDKKNIEDIKGTSDKAAKDTVSAAQDAAKATKADTTTAKDTADAEKQKVKPKIDVNQFKTQQ